MHSAELKGIETHNNCLFTRIESVKLVRMATLETTKSHESENPSYVLADADATTISSCMTPAMSFDRMEHRPRVPPGSIIGGFGFPPLSNFWSKDRTDIVVVYTLDFLVVKDHQEFCLKLPIMSCPHSLSKYMSQDEWVNFCTTVNRIGNATRWNTSRSLIIVVVLFVMVVVVNLGGDGLGFSLGDEQICILIVLGIVMVKLIFDEWRENRTRDSQFHALNKECGDYSDLLRPRGICVAFRCAETGDHGLVTDLTFYKVIESKEEAFLDVP